MAETQTTFGDLVTSLKDGKDLGKEHIGNILTQTSYTSKDGRVTEFKSPELSLIHWMTVGLRSSTFADEAHGVDSIKTTYFNQLADAIDAQYGFQTKQDFQAVLDDLNRQLDKLMKDQPPMIVHENASKVIN